MLNLDSVDYQIIKALYESCRDNIADFANKIGVTRQTITNRLRLLESNGIIQGYETIIHPSAFEYEILAITSISCELQETSRIIKQLLKFPEVSKVYLVTGSADLEVFGAFKNRSEIQEFLLEKVGHIKGIKSQNSRFILRNYWKPGYFHQKIIQSPFKQKIVLDEIDQRLLNLIRRNARLTVASMARQLDNSERTVAKHLKKLVNQKVIRFFQPIIDSEILGFKYSLFIDVKLKTQNVQEIIKQILKIKNIRIVNEVTGVYDLHCRADLRDMTSLHDFLQNQFRPLDGIQKFITNGILQSYYKWAI